MADFVIIPDATCDLPRELRDRFDIPDYVPGVLYLPDGTETRSNLDWENMTQKEFYSILKQKDAFFKTASASIGEATEVIKKQFAQGRDVLLITIAARMSVTFDVCVKAGETLKEAYPDRRLVVFDSLRYSAGISVQVAAAAYLRKQGKSLDETVAWLQENCDRVHQMGPLDDLFFCKKMGRVSNMSAIMGTLIGIRPMADFNRDGANTVIGKTKGAKKAENATVEYVRRTIEHPEEQIVFVAHSNREEAAQSLKARIEKEISPREVLIIPIGQACGPNIGPGLVAAYYYGKPISEGLADESALMADILSSK
ncbi:MAG: DegV family protein [Clostridia bacterium]|nr:DegV family protein [Clostridia bacterium]